MVRARAAFAETASWMWIASAICAPTRITGLR